MGKTTKDSKNYTPKNKTKKGRLKPEVKPKYKDNDRYQD